MARRFRIGFLSLAAVTAVAWVARASDGWTMFDRRVGMFVHWGIYSAGGYHEQERMRLYVPRAEYAKYASRFTAENFSADAFVDAAESLGAEYIVFTAKHHDGFCMWDTKTTGFNVMNTPAKRDIIGELAAACKRRGMKLGFYYSNPDWNHPNAYNPKSTHQVPPEEGDVPDLAKYREYVKAQITELLTNYGEIVCLFWDIPTKVDAPEMNTLVRRLQPNIKINDRGWGSVGDYSTPERDLPKGKAFPRPTEACDSVGARSWGYRANEDYRTVGYCTRSIDHFLSLGGNYLLNVGPKADGTIPAEALALLKRTGDWYRRVRESYRDVETMEIPEEGVDDPVLLTRRGNAVYVHCPKGLAQTGLDLRMFREVPVRATVLNDGSVPSAELTVIPHNYESRQKTLHLGGLDADRYANEAVVIRLDFADEWDYVRRKWREDLSDPSTGLGALALRTNLAEKVGEWKRSMPWPEVKARAFAWLCERTAIDVSERDWFPTFAFWTRHTDKLHPFLPQTMKRRDEVMSARHPDLKDRWPYWCGYPDFDHSAPDWDDVLAVGFAGMAERLRKNWKDTDYYPPRKTAIEAVFRLIDRLIAQGERKVGETRCRAQVESLKRLRTGAPQTAYDVLNLIYLYWVMSENFEGIQVRTLGNLDRLLTPFYRADLAAGRTTEAEFRDQLRHFWWQWGSIANYWGQPVYFGGTKADGTTEYNEVSAILLDIHDELALPTPKLHVKIGKSTPDWVWNRTIDMARRMRPISFLGEESHARVIRSMGYTAEQARTFLIWGCYEWAIRDSANDTFGAAVNLLKPIEEMMAEAAEGRFAAEDFGRFKDAYLERIAGHVDAACAFAREDEVEMAEINPSLLFSLATPHSVEVGKDAYSGGMENGNNTGIWLIGIGSTVDALAAVREFVYERKAVTLSEFGKTLAADWAGADDLRRRVRRSKCKWGNNDPVANALASELTDRLAGRINGHANGRGGRFKAFGLTARWHYLFGAATGATPDGRKAREEISKNVSPTMGADTEGATALIASAPSIDALDLPGDYPLDVALLPATASGEKGLSLMRSLIEEYFGNGGLVIQFNIHDADTLRDAQKHPEKYENLQVRVAGWNVRWNDIPKAEQDAFIRRAEEIAR